MLKLVILMSFRQALTMEDQNLIQELALSLRQGHRQIASCVVAECKTVSFGSMLLGDQV